MLRARKCLPLSRGFMKIRPALTLLDDKRAHNGVCRPRIHWYIWRVVAKVLNLPRAIPLDKTCLVESLILNHIASHSSEMFTQLARLAFRALEQQRRLGATITPLLVQRAYFANVFAYRSGTRLAMEWHLTSLTTPPLSLHMRSVRLGIINKSHELCHYQIVIVKHDERH